MSQPQNHGQSVEYEAAWRDLRWRRNLIFLAVFAYPIVAAVVIVGLSFFSLSAANSAVGWAMYLCFAGFIGTNLYRLLFICPRCDHRFFWSPIVMGNPWAGACLNCALPKWATNDANDSRHTVEQR
jgi:hypothetical protein